MPDISMCMHDTCPSKEKCYRYKAVPNGYQSYSNFQNDPNKVKCDHFQKIMKGDRIITIKT